MDSLKVLRKYWGYDGFRPLQEDIIQSVLDGQDTLALMPTGGGKSICFQVPAMLMEGICVVVTPLIALMKDQVENLRSREIEAISIFSGMGRREIDIALDNCIYGKIKFLYISPERLGSELVRERIRHMRVNLFAVDEAHCISQWGYDFRPSYLHLSHLRELHPTIPFLAVTATATTDVVSDIQKQLGFRVGKVFKMSFFRENLSYMVLPEEDKSGRMLRIIRKLGGSGIVYVRNRRETQETARFLVNEGVSADFYHAGLPAEERTRKQDEWRDNRIRVIVATNAFGMGIDKPDVRFVIHLEPPDSLEAYYQEAGRGGRDGKKSHAVLLWQEADIEQLHKNFEESFPPLEYIRKVYQLLGNYYQLAYGAGEQLNFDFDLGDFCQRYGLIPVPVLSALKFLERSTWVALSESVYIPSRLKFELPQQELYRFQVENQQYDGFIKAILRNYGGAFEHYIPIKENELARKYAIPYPVIIRHLDTLKKLGIIDYLPRTDSPQIQFLRPRVDSQHLDIDAAFIRIRKNTKKTKLDAVLDYIARDICRSRQLLAYFDEPESTACGTCDVCLRKARKTIPGKEWLEALKTVLSGGGLSLRELVDRLDIGDEEQRLSLIRKSLDQGMLEEREGLFFYPRKSGDF